MDIILIRHAETEWNRQKKLQGLSDIPALPQALSNLQQAKLKKSIFADCHACYTSPLQRANATAKALTNNLNLPPAIIDDRLIEMSFGLWEGQTLADIRTRLSFVMAREEAKGLHFKAPNGESPHQVQTRLQSFLADIYQPESKVVLVTHKAVIRSFYALASGWDMQNPARDKLHYDYRHAHIFTCASNGEDKGKVLRIKQLNLAYFV